MATMVCRAGSQPCPESLLVEPRTPFWFKYSSPKHNFCQSPTELALKSCFRDLTSEELSHEKETSKISVPSSIWQCPEEQILTETAAEASYVHPLVKRSQSSLSERSLDMCTENLGNETGSDFIGSSFFTPAELKGGRNSLSTESVNSSPSRQLLRAGKLNHLHKFPPPLTTISGSKSLSVRPHRVDGRLIIQVVETTQRKNPNFLAERSHGRLRLSLLISNTSTCTDTEVAEEANRKQHGEDANEEENDAGENGNGEAGQDNDRTEMEKLERVCNCRCREGENESYGSLLGNWEPRWISSS